MNQRLLAFVILGGIPGGILAGIGCHPNEPTTSPSADAPPQPSGVESVGPADECTALTREALPALEGTDPAATVPKLDAACACGDPAACFSSGLAASRGIGRDPDLGFAAQQYTRACEANHAAACHNIGVFRLSDAVGDPDPAAAAVAFERGCQASFWVSCVNLGMVLLDGYGGQPADPRRAREFFESACGATVSSGPDEHDKDEQQAGKILGCFQLGRALNGGVGGPADKTRAASLYDLACDEGYAPGCFNRAFMLERGKPSAKDVNAARDLYQRACDLDFGPACHELGAIYANGDGVRSDMGRAKRFFSQGCSLGHAESSDLAQKRSRGCEGLMQTDAYASPEAEDQ
ncbi:MAG: tetratricopeptide repeat protein, partial [Myxococcota bacterium]